MPLNGSGVATTTTTPATGGTYYYEAIYTPTDSTNFTASTSNVVSQPSTPPSVRRLDGRPVVARQPDGGRIPVTYVADVLGLFPPGPPFNAGTITFKDNGVIMPSCVNVPVAFGLAICSVTYQTTANSPRAPSSPSTAGLEARSGHLEHHQSDGCEGHADQPGPFSSPTNLGSTLKSLPPRFRVLARANWHRYVAYLDAIGRHRLYVNLNASSGWQRAASRPPRSVVTPSPTLTAATRSTPPHRAAPTL